MELVMRNTVACIAAAMVGLSTMASFPLLMPQEKAGTPRKDRQGDKLPQGAIARLGTVRFHNPQPINTIAFAPDGKELLVLAHEYPNSALRLWNIADGKERSRFELKDANYPDAWYTRAA